MTRVNLALNPSFRNGMDLWSSTGGAALIARATGGFYGSTSAQVICAAGIGSGLESQDPISVIPDRPYSVSAYVFVPVTQPSANVAVKLRWYTLLGALIEESSSDIVEVEFGEGWVRVSAVTTSPANAVTCKITVQKVTPSNVGNVFYVDAVLLEQSAYVGGFLDNYPDAVKANIVNTALTPVPVDVPPHMQLNADITLNDLVLNTIDEDGTLWVCTSIDGWWGHSTPEIPGIPRGVEDGDYDVTGRYQARQIVLSGVFIPSSSATLGAARDRFISATNLVRKGAWLRSNEEPTRASFVRLSGRPAIETVNARGRTEFSIGLRAADPIRYEWNDADPDGLTTVTILGSSPDGTLHNIGTADVTAVFEIEGPVGTGTTIYNRTTNETITLVQSLRGANSVATVTKTELFKGVATLTTSAPHYLTKGDSVVVSGLGVPYDSGNQLHVVSSASSELPYSISFEIPDSSNIPEQTTSGSLRLARNDILEIDTYAKSVALNGEDIGFRSRVDTLVDWIKITPGENEVEFDDTITDLRVFEKKVDSGVATIRTKEAHFLTVGEMVRISFTETSPLKRKSLTSNVATLTTEEPHAMSVGDRIDVETTEIADVVTKELTSNVAKLTTALDGAFVVGDSIVVALPTTFNVVTKSVAANVVTLRSSLPHKFSSGDSVTVAFQTSKSLTTKALSGNVATLATSTAHGYSIGDSVTVTLPVNATVITKATSGVSVTLATATAHNFSVGDRINIAFPTSAVLTGTRSTSGSPNLTATVNTSGAHGFDIGDKITINLGTVDSYNVTNGVATATHCTITTNATHYFTVGELIYVASDDARYNGTYTITSVTANTITYAKSGAVSASAAKTGYVANRTIQRVYNGTHIVESMTSTSITYYVGIDADPAVSSSTYGPSPLVTDVTNTEISGTYPIDTIPTTTTFTYTRS